MNLKDFPYYGDQFRWFIARVVNNNDPDMLGRVQIRISGIHSPSQEDIPEIALPWASVILPSTEGGTSGIGRIPQLLPGSLVVGFFIDGKTSQVPLVMGSLNQIEVPSDVQKTGSSVNSDTSDLTRGGNIGSDGTVIRNQVKNIKVDDTNIDKRRLAAMIFFTDNGYTPSQAAGIVGNLEAESNFSTTVVSSVKAEKSQGIAQWNPAIGRLQSLKQFAKNYNLNWQDFHTQLQFVKHELKGKPKSGDGGSSHSWVQRKMDSTSCYEGGVIKSNATWIICKYYEAPKDAEGKLKQREKYARNAYTQFMQNYKTSAGEG